MKNMQNSYYAIGLMSGTSLDGLDISYSHFTKNSNEWNFKLLKTKSISYSAELKNKLRNAIHLSGLDLTKFDVELGKYFANEVADFIQEENIIDVDVIGSHGHTVFHQPENGFTLQVGSATVIHERVKKIVVADFRSQDVVLGGQGAPLVPIGDKYLFSEYYYRINLGGFANVSFEEKGKIVAFDICAVNTVLNKYSNKLGLDYDDKGSIASKGKVISDLFIELEKIRYYSQKSPKSLGVEWNEMILFPILDKFSNYIIEDILHTYTLHVVSQINKVLLTNINKKVLVSGGGAFNEFLVSLLRESKRNVIIVESKEITDFKEAIIFSFLGVLKIRGEVNCLSEVTGAKKDHSSGIIYNFCL